MDSNKAVLVGIALFVMAIAVISIAINAIEELTTVNMAKQGLCLVRHDMANVAPLYQWEKCK